MHQPIPDDWQHLSTLHREAWEHCRRNAQRKPVDCVCCGCHTQAADGISATRLHLLAQQEECPAEKRALNRIAQQR